MLMLASAKVSEDCVPYITGSSKTISISFFKASLVLFSLDRTLISPRSRKYPFKTKISKESG